MQHDNHLQAFLKWVDAPIVDVRSAQDYAIGHIKEACHIPASQLLKRMHELPKSGHSLRLVGNKDDCEAAQKILTSKRYSVVAALIWSQQQAEQLSQLQLLENGTNSRRLWQPAQIISQFVEKYPLSGQNKKALDVACGSGRDAVYLALHGWQVSAIDYLPGSLQKLSALAERHQVEISCYQLDLETSEQPLKQIEGQFDLIVVVRYLHRPLLHQLRDKLNPGGFIIYQTFMEGCERFGKPKNPRFLLKAGELANIFNEYKILVDDVELLEDGRPTNIFIAQCPSST